MISRFRDFSTRAAPVLIREKPGMTAIEIAMLALERGMCASQAMVPEHSLANTLNKGVQEGRIPGVIRRKDGREYRFYPAPDNGAGSPPSTSAPKQVTETADAYEPVTVMVPASYVADAQMLVDVGRFRSLSDACTWWIAEGVAAQQPYMSQVRRDHEAMENIRKRYRN